MRAYGLRILLFLGTNLAVVMLLSFTMRLLGVDSWLMSNGIPFGYLLILSVVLGFSGSFISLALSKVIAKWSTKAQVITEPRTEGERWLLETVRRQAEASGIGMPEVAVYPSADVNAFATGMRRDHALVAVSEGLLRAMTRREVEAVLAHEVSHVANGDMVTLTLIQGVVNTFVIFLSRVVGYAVDRLVFRNDRGVGIGYWIGVLASELLLGLLATMIVMWFSRRREFRADEGAARLVGPAPMIEALARLQQIHNPSALPQAMSAFGIRGGKGSGLRRLFLSHPPLDDRIAALSELAADAR